jgi:hypothetical protein
MIDIIFDRLVSIRAEYSRANKDTLPEFKFAIFDIRNSIRFDIQFDIQFVVWRRNVYCVCRLFQQSHQRRISPFAETETPCIRAVSIAVLLTRSNTAIIIT